ncbi:unnamed protein product [Notodromas monacha]|uniref:C2 domain-containing protein n=1 Tax=Notodromas monacha TaxID=399045 RepID=A0A7R9BFD4_9CRUS|nr:unnamed protein product [Notodromas monacha]CAG0913085.1 unnamed protein product [Notodromas monacha]
MVLTVSLSFAWYKSRGSSSNEEQSSCKNDDCLPTASTIIRNNREIFKYFSAEEDEDDDVDGGGDNFVSGARKSWARIFTGTGCSEKREDPTTFVSENNIPARVSQDADSNKLKESQLRFKLGYVAETRGFQVTVVKCFGLPAEVSGDFFVRVELQPLGLKGSTRILRNTLNPEYDEEFTFFGVKKELLQASPFLWLSLLLASVYCEEMWVNLRVLSFDRFSRDVVVGEVVVPLTSVDLDAVDTREFTVPLLSQRKPELLVSLGYQPAARRLSVVVLKARHLMLPSATFQGPSVEVFLMYKEKRLDTKKTSKGKPRRTSGNPAVFNESFVFDVPEGSPGGSCGDLDPLDPDFIAHCVENLSLHFLLTISCCCAGENHQQALGHLEMGLSTFSATEAASEHWQEVWRSPRRQVAEWHTLMDPL